LIKTFVREKEKPIVVFAQDNSESIILNTDSAYYKGAYKKDVDNFLEKLNDKYDVRIISWGDKVIDQPDFTFSDKQTDFSELQKQLNVRYGNRNIGAIVVASDGLYNRGSSPLYNDELKVPVYTVAMGDTTIRKDLIISSLNYNKTVYVGNSFPVEITVNARQCSGENTTLSILQDSVVVFTKSINIRGNRFSQIIPFLTEAKKAGLIHYKIRLTSLPGETTLVNNERDIYIEATDTKQKVLIVGNSPHPDIGALKLEIESNENYSVSVAMAAQPVNVKEFNLVILHNLPSSSNPASEILDAVKASSTPVWFIVGSQTSVGGFNNLQAGISLNTNGQKSNTVQPSVNTNFSRFIISDEFKRMIPLFPPLTAPFGDIGESTDNSVLLFQQIGTVLTDEPLQLFNENYSPRTGILIGEGIWRWRMSDYSLNGNFNVFREWLMKSVQNLSVKENRSRFRLIGKNSFAENETINFDAEFYNDNYELINSPDVNIVISNSSNMSFTYTFSKTEKGYSLNAGYLPSGQYKYKASVNSGGKNFQSSGEFSITALQVEQVETVADHQLLNTLSGKSGGEMFYPTGLKELGDKLLNREDLKTVTYSHYKLRDLVDWKLIFFLLLALMSLEWFLRKRSGAY
jgi:hypothetical protein